MTKLLTILLIVGMSAPFGFAQEVELSADEAAVLKSKVLKTASNIQTITSNFVQKKHLDFLSNDIETFGKMVFKAPDLIKWEYTDPYRYSIVFKEDKLHINDEGTREEINLKGNKRFQSLNDLIAKSMKGDLFDEQEFRIAYFKKGGHFLVKFYPNRKELNTYIKAFELTFDAKEANVLAVKMIEPTEDYTQIVFENRQLNTSIADEVFSN